MLARLSTFALVGIDAVPVEAEIYISSGLPKTILVGLPEAAVRESIHRIERALVNLNYHRHSGRTIVNLAPADLKKDAGSFDLPIALGLLVATAQLLPTQLDDVAMVGELAAHLHKQSVFSPISSLLSQLQQASRISLRSSTPTGSISLKSGDRRQPNGLWSSQPQAGTTF